MNDTTKGLLGSAVPLGTSGACYAEVINGVLQTASLVVGLAVGIVTFYDWYKKRGKK